MKTPHVQDVADEYCYLTAEHKYRVCGPPGVSQHELLSLIVGKRPGDIAGKLLKQFHSIRGIAQVPVHALTKTKGVGDVLAVRIHAACAVSLLPADASGNPSRVTCPKEAARWFSGPQRRTENLMALYMNCRGRVLGMEVLSAGSVDRTLVDPREVFRPALLMDARSVVLAHNHPSGDLSPSKEDIDVTKRIAAVGASLGVQLADHLILGHGASDFRSLAEMGFLAQWGFTNASGLTG